MPLEMPDGQVALVAVTMVLCCLLVAAGWVYRDARAHVARGHPIVFSAGGFRIRTPVGWFVACVLLVELFIPVYLDSRGPA